MTSDDDVEKMRKSVCAVSKKTLAAKDEKGDSKHVGLELFLCVSCSVDRLGEVYLSDNNRIRSLVQP